jgi:hypothetical protein
MQEEKSGPMRCMRYWARSSRSIAAELLWELTDEDCWEDY